jgi:8-oxo-dGTP diphosphatase
MPQFTYDYPRPALTVDIAIVAVAARPRILLIRRKHGPFEGCWALPGGFVDEGERLIDAARRELREETALEDIDLEQMGAFGDPGRDPRGWTVSVVYLAKFEADRLNPQAGDDAAETAWFPFDALPPLAFDHSEILKQVKERLNSAT